MTMVDSDVDVPNQFETRQDIKVYKSASKRQYPEDREKTPEAVPRN